MNKKITISIGIPAYNEAGNIENLIKDILKQNQTNFTINEIIVSSDGSTDATAAIIKKYIRQHVVLLDNKDRKGIARGINQIMHLAKGDIVVLLDGDIRIPDATFIAELTLPIIRKEADLTSSAISPVVSRKFFTRLLTVSKLYKTILFENIRSGNNIYTCYGLARGFSRRFYKKLHFPVSIGNDMYSYLACIKTGYTFLHTPHAVAKFQLPANFTDHERQSTRFLITENQQEQIFEADFVQKETRIPILSMMKSFAQYPSILIKYPVETVSYIAVLIFIKLKPKSSQKNQTWDIAISSKNVSTI